MQKTLIGTAVAAILSAGALLPSSASAMTMAAPAGVRVAIDEASTVDQVRHRCYRARGGWVCPRHRKRVIVGGYPAVGVYAPGVAVGVGYPYWGYGYGGWGHSRTVVRRHHHHRHHRHRR